ncbi:hypothetical protein LEP1GSC068_0538 [Leptospira sp. Fiocruz LV3954]|nr:hypothetical protein LEP1GSC068_0538 [Leptospira sp. Fiocruz LV3954]
MKEILTSNVQKAVYGTSSVSSLTQKVELSKTIPELCSGTFLQNGRASKSRESNSNQSTARKTNVRPFIFQDRQFLKKEPHRYLNLNTESKTKTHKINVRFFLFFVQIISL